MGLKISRNNIVHFELSLILSTSHLWSGSLYLLSLKTWFLWTVYRYVGWPSDHLDVVGKVVGSQSRGSKFKTSCWFQGQLTGEKEMFVCWFLIIIAICHCYACTRIFVRADILRPSFLCSWVNIIPNVSERNTEKGNVLFAY